MSLPHLEKMYELEVLAEKQSKRIAELEATLRQKDRTLAGVKHWLKVASEYKNEDLGRRLDGVQAALAKAAEYEGREQRRGRR